MTIHRYNLSDHDLLTLQALWSLYSQGLMTAECGTHLGHIVEEAEDIAQVRTFDTEGFRSATESSLLRLRTLELVEIRQVLEPSSPGFDRIFMLHAPNIPLVETLLMPEDERLPEPGARLRPSLLAERV